MKAKENPGQRRACACSPQGLTKSNRKGTKRSRRQVGGGGRGERRGEESRQRVACLSTGRRRRRRASRARELNKSEHTRRGSAGAKRSLLCRVPRDSKTQTLDSLYNYYFPSRRLLAHTIQYTGDWLVRQLRMENRSDPQRAVKTAAGLLSCR